MSIVLRAPVELSRRLAAALSSIRRNETALSDQQDLAARFHMLYARVTRDLLTTNRKD